MSVKGTVKASAPSVGEPMPFNGTYVKPGDLVVADDDGVVIIPQEAVERTLVDSEARAEKEARMMEALRGGRTTVELMGLSDKEVGL